MPYYKFAEELGVGFNVYSNDRLVAWFSEEWRAVQLVEALKQEKRHDPVLSQSQ